MEITNVIKRIITIARIFFKYFFPSPVLSLNISTKLMLYFIQTLILIARRDRYKMIRSGPLKSLSPTIQFLGSVPDADDGFESLVKTSCRFVIMSV